MSAPQMPRPDRLYTPAEVADKFRVDPKTVTRWAKSGKIPASAIVKTLGAHRRYNADHIDALLRGEQP